VLDESAVPVAQRVLTVEGRASAALLKLIRQGLPRIRSGEVLFVMPFAYADLPLGKRFDVWSPDGRTAVRVQAELVAVTQQFGKPFDEVPHGWKTFTLVRFSPDVPESVATFPEVDDWYEREPSGLLCTQDTWAARAGHE